MTSQAASTVKIANTQGAAQSFDFLDLKAQFSTLREEIFSAIARVMESQHFILGAEVKSLEEEIAAMVGAEHAVGCASGTDALILSLMAAGVGPGDEVITTPFSFIATAGAIAHVGAKPVFVDVRLDTYNIDSSLIEAAMTPKTRGIIPVHLFGLPADMDAILAIARAHSLVVIEDAAQAIGARYEGRIAGTMGDFGCFSFFPSKNLGGSGDGGMVVTNNEASADRLRMLRVHGSKKKYHHEILGTNSRLDALQAAILRVKLPHLSKWAAGRQNRADRYRSEFADRNLPSLVTPADPGARFQHVYNQFTIHHPHRDGLREYLKENGVPTEIYYPLCLHLQPAFAYLGHGSGDFPVAEKLSAEALSLPVYPELTDGHQDRVVDSITAFLQQRNQA